MSAAYAPTRSTQRFRPSTKSKIERGYSPRKSSTSTATRTSKSISPTFPREIVVGVDGSDEAEHAFEAARSLATRRHSKLRSVVAHGGKDVNLAQVTTRHRLAEHSPAAPVTALVGAAACADLLVVGSRGLHGIRALGSVSERVAHDASSSVLVVR